MVANSSSWQSPASTKPCFFGKHTGESSGLLTFLPSAGSSRRSGDPDVIAEAAGGWRSGPTESAERLGSTQGLSKKKQAARGSSMGEKRLGRSSVSGARTGTACRLNRQIRVGLSAVTGSPGASSCPRNRAFPPRAPSRPVSAPSLELGQDHQGGTGSGTSNRLKKWRLPTSNRLLVGGTSRMRDCPVYISKLRSSPMK